MPSQPEMYTQTLISTHSHLLSSLTALFWLILALLCPPGCLWIVYSHKTYSLMTWDLYLFLFKNKTPYAGSRVRYLFEHCWLVWVRFIDSFSLVTQEFVCQSQALTGVSERTSAECFCFSVTLNQTWTRGLPSWRHCTAPHGPLSFSCLSNQTGFDPTLHEAFVFSLFIIEKSNSIWSLLTPIINFEAFLSRFTVQNTLCVNIYLSLCLDLYFEVVLSND